MVDPVSLREFVPDSWVWKGESYGFYTVKSTYNIIMSQYHLPEDDFLNRLWNKLVPLKVSSFAWRLAQNRIPSEDNLDLRGIIQNSQTVCGGYDQEIECFSFVF